MKIQVIGTGCPKCKKLCENVEIAIGEIGGNHTVEKITDINQIVDMGVMMTPALAIDGLVKSSGRLLNVTEIKEIIEKTGLG